MSFFSKKKETSESTESENTNLTTSLYEQNIEIASKNKSLSALRKLYELSISVLDVGDLASNFSKVIREELSFEFVAIYTFNQEQKMFYQTASSSSTRLNTVENEFDFHLGKLLISQHDKKFISDLLETENQNYTENIELFWGKQIDSEQYEKIQKQGHLKSLLVSPLRINDNITGMVAYGFNRSYQSFSDHEIESLGNFNNIIAVSTDRAILYQKLQNTNSQLEAANKKLTFLDKQKTEFVSLASHQLRGPLTAINGYVELLIGGDYGEINQSISEPLKKIQTATRDLSVLVGDYLDVTRIELGKMKYNFDSVSLSEMAFEVVYELEPVMQKHQLELTVKISDQECLVHADRNKIKQVMVNLVDNAIKYSNNGSITISVSINDHTKKVMFSVMDTGPGINPEILPILFDKFVRAPGAEQANSAGTGLGLFVAKKIISEHGGRIWAESEGLGKGATFSFELDLLE